MNRTMNKNNTTYDLFPRSHKDLTPSEFLRITPEEKRNIKSVRIVAPRLGSDSFGKIRIELATPEYVVK